MKETEKLSETLPAEVGVQEPQPTEEKKKSPKLSKALIELITRTATEAAVKAFSAEHENHKTRVRDRRYNNTKVLFKSYRSLVDYNETTIYDIAQMATENATPTFLTHLV